MSTHTREGIASQREIRIALAGNPNCGKTTLFNAITGSHHKVGNYPGVTVEKREGSLQHGDRRYRFTDLPGIYSLTAYSQDEVVARDFLLDEKPDLIIDVLDSTNLDRNLYLCLQFQELGIPVIGALNMSDEAEEKGISIDVKALSEILGMPLVKTTASKGQGIDELLQAADRLMDAPKQMDLRSVHYGSEIETWLEAIQKEIEKDAVFAQHYPNRWLAVKLLEKDSNVLERLEKHQYKTKLLEKTQEAILWIEKHYGRDAEIVVSEQRYGYIHGACKETVKVRPKINFSVTEAVDRVIMNRYLALPIFVGVLWAVFQLTFILGEYPMLWLENLFTLISNGLNAALPDTILRSLLVDGIIGGVGGVFSFVPLIVILFFLLSLLEDLGYMSRAAFACDKTLHAFGLHGQSIFPLMLGFGCSVPAIMAARTLKSPRDRIVTVLVVPFMSCGAKLPVHVLLAAAFFPENAANMVMIIYAIGVVIALASAWVLKKTVLRGDPTPFVMELPPYRAPTLRGLLWHVWEKTWIYIRKAGTVILASTILIWVITSFPAYEPGPAVIEGWKAEFVQEHGQLDDEEFAGFVETSTAQAALSHSYAGRIGHFIEPIFKPMGFDWKIAVASVTGFAAKEIVVSTLGVLYRVGVDETEESESLREALKRDPIFNPLVAFTLMLFILIIPPCFAALSAIRAELGGKWLGFAIVFMLSLGWTLSFAVYYVGSLFGIGV